MDRWKFQYKSRRAFGIQSCKRTTCYRFSLQAHKLRNIDCLFVHIFVHIFVQIYRQMHIRLLHCVQCIVASPSALQISKQHTHFESLCIATWFITDVFIRLHKLISFEFRNGIINSRHLVHTWMVQIEQIDFDSFVVSIKPNSTDL